MTRLRDELSGRYTIERELGHGAMATVYLAREEKHGRQVAIKVLHPDLSAAVGAERFLREIQIVARLAHPHILPLYDSGEAAGSLYYVMPYVEGESLRSRLVRESQLPIEEAIRITCEVASALDYAHRHGIIHRDVKPENILIEDGHAMVADFGIAHVVSAAGGDKLTGTGLAVGTPVYMSPEQASASREIDGRSDVYSLACVLYEMLVGEPPFSGRNTQSILARHALEPARSLTTVRGSVPDDIEDAVLRGLAKVPADRFPTAGQFADTLGACSGIVPWRTPGSMARVTPRGRATAVAGTGQVRRLTLVSLGAFLTLGLVGASGWLWLQSRGEDAASASAASLDPRRIAVLYFRDLSPRRDLGYLADALTEALISELDEVKNLDVVSKTGVGQFKQSAIAVDSIARVLKAGTLVEGSVESAGDRLRVSVKLIDGRTGDDFDIERFEQQAGDLLLVRDRLVREVASFLRSRLGEEVQLRDWQAATRDAMAWGLAQRAEKAIKDAETFVLAGDTSAATRRVQLADSLLRQSESRDPDWVEPIVMRGTVAYRHSRIASDPTTKTRWISQGLRYAERALALDPKNAAGLELRGTLRYSRWLNELEPDPKGASDLLRLAEVDLRAAVRMSPSRASAWSVLSHLYANKPDRIEAAIAARHAFAEDAYRVEPHVIWQLYSTEYDNEQVGPAVHWCNEGRRRFPANALFVQCQLWLLTLRGTEPNLAAAWGLIGELQNLTPPKDWELAGREARMLVAAALARAGLPDSARRVLERSRGDPTIDPTRNLVMVEAIVRTILGDRTEAVQLLKIYLVANPGHLSGMAQSQWWWRDLKGDPRFQELVGAGS